MTATATSPSSSREMSVIGGVAGVTSTVRSPSVIRCSAVERSVEQLSRSDESRSEMSRTPRRVETKKPTNRNSATSAPSRTSSATRRRAAENLSIRVTSSASSARRGGVRERLQVTAAGERLQRRLERPGPPSR